MSHPRVFGLPHLSEDAVAAFADGVLSAAAASRAQRHCAECPECADAVRGQRETAMMLRAAQAPSLPSGLLDRLTGVPMSAPLPPPRGGLPTVLNADGTAMFVAHDVRKAREAGSAERSGGQPRAAAQTQAQTPARHHRRAVLPVTVLASAAAVVAAGTFGGHVSTLAADRQAPSGAANVAGLLAGVHSPAARATSPLAGTGSLLPVSHPSAAPASTVPGQASTVPARRLSVTLTPPGPGARQPGTTSQQPGTAAAAGTPQPPTRPSARHGTWSSTAFAATMAGAPIATP